jgi:hypothetical protein
MQEVMEEIFYDKNGVRVSTARLATPGGQYPLEEIREARIVEGRRALRVPLSLSLAGLAGMIAGVVQVSGAALVVGTMLLVVGWLTWVTQAVLHRIVLDTPSAEVEAVAWRDRAEVGALHEAICGALAQRVAA